MKQSRPLGRKTALNSRSHGRRSLTTFKGNAVGKGSGLPIDSRRRRPEAIPVVIDELFGEWQVIKKTASVIVEHGDHERNAQTPREEKTSQVMSSGHVPEHSESRSPTALRESRTPSDLTINAVSSALNEVATPLSTGIFPPNGEAHTQAVSQEDIRSLGHCFKQALTGHQLRQNRQRLRRSETAERTIARATTRCNLQLETTKSLWLP
jgi:hypothetical protein